MRRFLPIILMLLAATGAFAQANATLGGTVSDSSGALVPGVEVRAANVNTGVVSTTLTNEKGNYQFPSLQPGTYRISDVCAPVAPQAPLTFRRLAAHTRRPDRASWFVPPPRRRQTSLHSKQRERR